METVTAAVTTYKRDWKSVSRALDSIINQTATIQEIFLVDDNEPENPFSREIRRNLIEYPQVTYISQGENCGVSSARNFAAKNANTDWIAFLDDDDYWLSGKIEKQLSAADKDTGIVFAYGMKRNEKGEDTGHTWQKSMFLELPGYLDMLKHDYVGSASVPLIRLKAFRQAGGFRKMPAVEDYDLWIRIARDWKIRGIDDSLYIKNMPAGEHISRNLKNVFAGYEMIYKCNLDTYERHPYAEKWIMYNIMRTGIRSKQTAVIPYCFKWLGDTVKCIGKRKVITKHVKG